MAKRPTKLTEVTREGLEASNATLDRRRQQLDDAREQGPGSTEEQATEGADSGLLDVPGGRGRDAGAEGAPGEEAVADAEVADVGGEPEGERGAGLLVEQRGQSPDTVRDRLAREAETDPAAPNGQEAPDLNPIAGVGDAPASPLADVAGSGLRGTSTLTTPEAEGVREGPSVAETPGGAFNSRLATHSSFGTVQFFTEDEDGNTLIVFEDQTVTVKENEFTVVRDNGTLTVTNNGDSITEVRDNNASGSLDVSTTTFPDGQATTTTTSTRTNEDGSVTTTTTNPDGSSSSTTTAPVVEPTVEVPADDTGEVPELAGTIIGGEVQAPRRGPDDGATDPTEGDEIAFGVPISGPVPDLQDRLLGGDRLEPDFGGGGSAPSGPGNVDQTGAITPVDEADFGTGQRGPEQDAFDRVEQTQEQLPEDDEDDEDEDEQLFQRGDINGDGVVDRRDLHPEDFRPTTEVGATTAADLPERIDVDDD